MMLNSWLSYQFIKSNNNPGETLFLKDMWAVLSNLLADVGKAELRQVHNKKIEYF